MTKLLTIDVEFDTKIDDLILIANVIADNTESIYIIKDLFEDKKNLLNQNVYKIRLHHSKQYIYKKAEDLNLSAQVCIKCDPKVSMQKNIIIAENKILSFIL